MTTTPTKYATTINQTTGGQNTTWKNLDKLKKNTGHAITNTIYPRLLGSSQFPDTPAKLTFTGFGLNIPQDAEIRKITIEYKHDKIRACYRNNSQTGEIVPCGESGSLIPEVPVSKVCALSAPTIALATTNGQGTVISNLQDLANTTTATTGATTTGKGQAPTTTTKELSLTFNFNKGNKIPASFWNNLAVTLDYGRNQSNDKYGFIRLYYLRIRVEYETPVFTITASSSNTTDVYNGDDYMLRVDISDSLQTGKEYDILIVSPAGLSFKEFHGGGKFIQTDTHTFKWTPDMKLGWNTSEIVFETNFSFSSSETSKSVTFDYGVPAIDFSSTFTGTVLKRLAPTGEDETGMDNSQEIDESTFEEIETIKLIVDEWQDSSVISLKAETLSEFKGLLISKYSADEVSELSPSSWVGTLTGDITFDSYVHKLPKSQFVDGSHPFRIKSTSVGLQKVYIVGYDYVSQMTFSSYTYTDLKSYYILTIPDESNLTVPDMTLLTLTDEELDRLGDGFSYTLQSYLKQSTSDTYVRDWYKNFRIGVFNNRIEANCSTFYRYKNTGTSFEEYLQIPPRYSIDDDAYFIINVDKAIQLNINDTDYTIANNGSQTIECFEQYNMPCVFTKTTETTVNLTMTLYDGDDTELYAIDYQIQFNADEDTGLTPVVIDVTDYDNLTSEQIFNGAEYWSKPPKQVNTWESITCQFTHDKNYPLYIIITGDYPEGDQANNDILFTEPCIIESSVYTERLTNGIYPIPIDDIILNDGSTAEVHLNNNNQTEAVVFYDYPLNSNYGTGTDMAIRGIELTGHVEQTDYLVLYSKLKSPNGESRQRSIVLNDYDIAKGNGTNTFSIGGNGDLWGFNTLDMTNMEDWEAELTVSNTLNNTASTINFGDINLIFHIEQVDPQNNKVYIEGEDIGYYGAFITDVNVPEGLETDTNFLSIDGTDTNDAYRQNIREKTIKIEFEIGDNCSLKESTESLRQLTKLMVNERDEYNRPIPKRLQLSHYPDVYWEYIMEKAIDTELDITTYSCKAELTIPAGTSYDLDNTTTSSTGYVNGIAAINPNIIVKPTGQLVTIREAVTGQEFHINYNGGWEDKILEIDCENRIAWLKESEDDSDATNMNAFVDYNSDWFNIIGEYVFTGDNCVVRTVDFQERW